MREGHTATYVGGVVCVYVVFWDGVYRCSEVWWQQRKMNKRRVWFVLDVTRKNPFHRSDWFSARNRASTVRTIAKLLPNGVVGLARHFREWRPQQHDTDD